MTDYAPNTEPFLLPFQDAANVPNARTVVGANGIQVLDSGPGQNFTITPTGNILSLNNLSTTGFAYSTAGTLSTKTFESSATNTVSENSGVLSFSAVPSSSLQLINFKGPGSFSEAASNVLFQVGDGLALSSGISQGTVRYVIGAPDLAATYEGYILNTVSSFLPNSQDIGQLTTGILFNTISTISGGNLKGTLSTAIPDTDYMVPTSGLLDIAPMSPVLGRLITGSGTHWVNLDIGADNTFLQSNGTSAFWGSLSGSVAPSAAPYVTFTANGTLTNTQNIGLLTTGLLKNTVTSASGALTTAVNGTDYYGPGVPVAIADGGTGATTANAGFNALSPMAHNGDLITRTSNVASALQIGTNGQVLTVVSSLPVWTTPTTYALTTDHYVTLRTDSDLPNSFSLGSLTTGLMLNTVSGGIATISKAVLGTDYYGPGFAVPISDGGTGQTTKSAAFNALSPMTTAADLIVGGTSGAGTRLAKGTANQVLAMSSDASTIQWTTNSSDASGWSTFPALQNVAMATYKITGLGDPTLAQDAVTKNYLTTNYNTTAYVADIAHGGTGQTTANAAFNALSPLTTNGDIVIRASGVATNLAVGVGGQFLSVVGGLPAWTNFPSVAPVNGPYITYTSDGFLSNEQNLGALTTGLLLNTVTSGTAAITKATNGTDYYGPGYAVRIADGGTGQTTKAAAFDALSPMTTVGDVIYGGASGTGTRLAAGTDGQVLTLASGIPSWTIPSGVVPFSVLGSGVTAVAVVGQQGYVTANNSSAVVFTLPASMAAGAVVRVNGFGTAGWQIAQRAGQSIYFGNQTTTVGVTGGLSSTYFTDGVEIVCVVANTTFLVVSSAGNITYS